MIRIIANRQSTGRIGHAPVLYCDWCNQPITDVNMAMVKWEEDPNDDPIADSLVFLHKRACDECHTKRYATQKFAWDELRHFLGNIIQNVNHTGRTRDNFWVYLIESHCPDEEIAAVAKVATRIVENPDQRPPTMDELF